MPRTEEIYQNLEILNIGTKAIVKNNNSIPQHNELSDSTHTNKCTYQKVLEKKNALTKQFTNIWTVCYLA